MGVKKPRVLLIKDGIDVTGGINKHLVDINYIDAIDNELDGLTLTFSKMFVPPKNGDKISVSIGFDVDLSYIGEFYVTGWTEHISTGVMELKMLPVDFSKSLKQKRTLSYDKVSLGQILKKIAKRHSLYVKNDMKEIKYAHKAQTNESDLAFMHRLAQENNATFSIKNGTIIFRKKSLKKDNNLPLVTVIYDQFADLRIEHIDKTIYLSGEARFHKQSNNKMSVVRVGEKKDPRLVIEGSWKNEAEAKMAIEAEMERENSGTVRGSGTLTNTEIVAGVLMTIVLPDRIEESLQVTEVRHSIGYGGYKKHVTFTK